MGRSASPRTTGYLKYLIPVIVMLALALFFLLRTEREKESERVVRQEAVRHIEALKKEGKGPIDMEKADHFVSSQTVLTKKDRKTIITTPKELLKDQSLTAESPIKILVEEEKTIITTPRELLKDKTIDLETSIRVLKEEEKVIVTTVQELLEDQSITRDTPIRVLREERKVIATTLQELLEDQSISRDAPIRVFEKGGKVVVTTPQELLEDQSISRDAPIRVLREEKKILVTTPRELLEDQSITRDTPIRVLKRETKVVVTTPRELLEDQSITRDTPIKIVLREERMILTTPSQLLAEKHITLETPVKVVLGEPGEMVTVSKLLKQVEDQESSGKTFYVHTVTPQDVQGIWGIIQHGLTTQFRQGIPVSGQTVPREQSILTLDIPGDADEPRGNGYSSFLGTILDRKTRESHVYNYRNGRMGKNPDRISPGQELVITEFSQEELVKIYEHFKQLR